MDIYTEITSRIISELESGTIPWEKPWVTTGGAKNHVTGKPYSLLNQLMLGRPGEYLTFKQCQQEGGRVKKGEKASMVVFWKPIPVKETDKDGKEITKTVPLLRYFNVFHIDQCEGIKAKHTKESPNKVDPNEAAEKIVADYLKTSGVKLYQEESDEAFYSPSTDSIKLPLMAQFKAVAEYYSTAFHEMVHSTGHKSRLDRLEKTAFFGSESYSKEELVAEIGAAALVNRTGLETSKSFHNSAAYVQSWLKVLRGDKRFIVSAAGMAEKAVKLILNEA